MPVWWVAVSPDGRRLAVQTRNAVNPRSRVEVRDIASNAGPEPVQSSAIGERQGIPRRYL